MTLELENPLWRFAREFYARPGIAPALLLLQDEAGVDVILLLLVVYAHSALDRSLTAEDIDIVAAELAPWRAHTVLPLRQIRRDLKPPHPGLPEVEKQALRKAVKEAELRAEQTELAMAEAWLRERPPATGLPLEAALARLVQANSPHPAIDAALALIVETAVRLRPSARL